MSGWFAETFAALSGRNFRLLWAGSLLAFIAFFMSTVVQSVVAFDLTGTNSAVGFVVFAQGLSQIALGPLGGALADRISKRFVILSCQAVITGCFLALAILQAAGEMQIWLLALGSFLVGAAFSFLGPSRQSFVVDLVELRHRGNSIALTQVALNASRIIGPLVAGALLAVDRLDAAGAFFTMTGLYVLAMVTTALLPPSRPASRTPQSIAGDIAEALRYVNGHPRLRRLILSYVLIIMLGFPSITVLPGLVENEFNRDADSITILLGLNAVGGLAASLAVASLADSARAPAIYMFSALVFGLGLEGSGVAPTFWGLAVIMFFGGCGGGGFMTLNGAVVLNRTDPAFYGRVIALTFLAFGAFGLLALPIGFLADVAGERATTTALGIGVCLVVAAFFLLERAAGAESPRGPLPEPVAPVAVPGDGE